MLGCEQRRLVARDRCLRGQGVHALRPRDPRDRIHRERRDTALGDRPHELPLHERLQERNERLAAPEQGDLLLGRRLDAADQVGLRVQHRGIGGDRGARFRIRVVREPRLLTGAGLDEELDSTGRKARGGVGDEGHAALARDCLLRNADLHAAAEDMRSTHPRRGSTDTCTRSTTGGAAG